VTAVEEPGADRPLATSGEAPAATGGAFGGSAATELARFGTLALGPEEPQPVASATARSSATTATPAAQFRRRDPDIRRLWAGSAGDAEHFWFRVPAGARASDPRMAHDCSRSL
jgi:hypothetical protein